MAVKAVRGRKGSLPLDRASIRAAAEAWSEPDEHEHVDRMRPRTWGYIGEMNGTRGQNMTMGRISVELPTL